MTIEAEPNAAAEKIKWHNRRDDAYGLLCLSISRDLFFHLDGLSLPDEVWEKFQSLFGNIYVMRVINYKTSFFTESNQLRIIASLVLQIQIIGFAVEILWYR